MATHIKWTLQTFVCMGDVGRLIYTSGPILVMPWGAFLLGHKQKKMAAIKHVCCHTWVLELFRLNTWEWNNDHIKYTSLELFFQTFSKLSHVLGPYIGALLDKSDMSKSTSSVMIPTSILAMTPSRVPV